MDSHFNFDIEGICSDYNFRIREFYAACKILEREGLVSIPEREEPWSMLYIPIARNELYRFQVEHQRLGDMLQSMLRMYPGLLVAPVPIDERKIAARCYADAGQVVSMLTQLHEMHIVEYRPRPLGPQIYFPTERVDERSIYPAEQNYSLLKQSAERRRVAMTRYVGNGEVCRSRQLVAYFGEESDIDCGVCDVCRQKRHRQGGVEEAALRLLEKNAMTLESLTVLLRDEGYSDVTDALRDMLDRGELRLDGTTVAVGARTVVRREAP